MLAFSLVIFSLSVFAFLAFIVGAWAAFDITNLEIRSRVFAISFLASVFLSLFYQWRCPRVTTKFQAASFILLLLAIVLFFLAVGANQKKKLTAVHSTDLPNHLVCTGPYRHVRHPFYVSYIVTFFASALASAHPVPLACAVLAFLNYLYAAQSEERKFASSPLAADYERYRRTTGMFVPRLWPGRPRRN